VQSPFCSESQILCSCAVGYNDFEKSLIGAQIHGYVFGSLKVSEKMLRKAFSFILSTFFERWVLKKGPFESKFFAKK
jgi:hypothetical protein